MKTLKTFLCVVAILFSGFVFARAVEPVLNLTNEPVTTSSGKQLSADNVCQLVQKVAQGKQWTVAKKPDGSLGASLSWRANKHTIMVNIVCNEGAYSIAYKDSVNMNYMMKDGGVPHIHPYYNRYIRELADAIRIEAMSM